MSISKSISGDIYLAVATVAILFALLYAAIHELMDVSKQEERAYEVLSTVSSVHDLISEINDAESAKRGYVITGKSDFLEPYISAKTNVPKLLLELSKEQNQHTHQKRLSNLKDLVQKRLRMMDEIVLLAQKGEFNEASQIISSKSGLYAHNEIRNEANKLIDSETELLLKDLVRASESREWASKFLLVFGSFSSIALVLLLHRLHVLHSRLIDAAMKDELTGLLNRRALMHLAEKYIDFSARQELQCAVIFADLDGLKKINDEFGHHLGSEAIANFAKVFSSALRKSDLVCRYGGDEFVALLSIKTEDSVQVLISRINALLEEEKHANSGKPSLRASIGWNPVEGSSWEAVNTAIEKADHKMYMVKKERKQKAQPT